MVLALALGVACGPPSPGGVAASVGPVPDQGPGLGNLAWSESELFRPVGWIDDQNGVPPASAEFPITSVKPFGVNTAAMHDGYFVTVFAPDSGFGPGGLLLYDVSDPRSPTLVTRVWEPGPDGRTADFREAHAMAFSRRDGRALVALHTGRGVHLWDLADPAAPERVGSVELPGVLSGDYDLVAWQLAWQGRYLYVAGSGAGVFVVDTEDPTAPVLADRGGAPNPIPISELGGFRVGPLFAVGNLLVVSSMDNETGWAALDLSDPLHPSLTDLRTGEPSFYSTCFSGGRLAASARGGGARMVLEDLSDPWAIERLSDDLVIDQQLYCAFQDDHLFQGCEGEVVKVDLRDPRAPVVAGRGSLGREHADHGQVTPFGNLVFVGNDHGTGSAFLVHDRAPDTTPPEVTFMSPTPGAEGESTLTRIGLTFSDPVREGSVGPWSVVVRPEGGPPLGGRFTVQGHIVNFEPETALTPNVRYEVEVVEGGVEDVVGNPVAVAWRGAFQTSPWSADDPTAALSVRIVGPSTAEVGREVTFELVMEPAGEGSVRWRISDEPAWVDAADLGPLRHTFRAPGHEVVRAVVSNGARRVTVGMPVTVHRPLPAWPPRASHTLALDEARGRVWAVNHDHGSVAALDMDDLARQAEVGVCDGPRSVAVDDGGAAWVSCGGDGVVAVVDLDGGAARVERLSLHPGAAPAGLVVSPAGDRVYVASEAMGEIVAFDVDSRDIVARVAVGPRPYGVAVSGDGRRLWVTRSVSGDDGATVYSVDVEDGAVEVWTAAIDAATVDGEDRSRGVPNLWFAAGITPDEALLWLPGKQDNVLRGLFRDGQPLTFETTIRSVVTRLTASSGVELPGPRLDLNNRAPAVDVAFTPLGDHAILALQGSNRIAVHDAFSGAPLGAREVGQGVDGVVVSGDGRSLYAHHLLSRTVSRHDLSGLVGGADYGLRRLAEGATVEAEVLSPQVLEGKRIFYNADDLRMTRDGYFSCATCHPDGGEDGRVWDFTDRGEGLRNTTDLRGKAGLGQGPLHWTGNFDEVQDFENDIRGPFAGRGFLDDAAFAEGTRSDPLGDPKAGLSGALDALAAYVASLDRPPASPHRLDDGGWTAAALRGAELYETLGCAECHGGPQYTVSAPEVRYDVGTITAASGGRRGGPLDGLDVPSLRGLHATPPYLHDGSATTLVEVFTRYNPEDAHGVTSPLDAGALDDLVAFLLSID